MSLTAFVTALAYPLGRDFSKDLFDSSPQIVPRRRDMGIDFPNKNAAYSPNLLRDLNNGALKNAIRKAP